MTEEQNTTQLEDQTTDPATDALPPSPIQEILLNDTSGCKEQTEYIYMKPYKQSLAYHSQLLINACAIIYLYCNLFCFQPSLITKFLNAYSVIFILLN